jgi:hypothetical protein
MRISDFMKPLVILVALLALLVVVAAPRSVYACPS